MFKVKAIIDGKRKTVTVGGATEADAVSAMKRSHNAEESQIISIQKMACRHCGTQEAVSYTGLCHVCANILTWVNANKSQASESGKTLEEHAAFKIDYLKKQLKRYELLSAMVVDGVVQKPTTFVPEWNREAQNGNI